MRNTVRTFFPFLFDDLVVQSVDAAECLRAYLVQNEYRRGYRSAGLVLAVFVFDDDGRRRDRRVVVEWVGEEVLLCGWFLVWVTEEVLKGKRAQPEEVSIDDLKVALR